MSPDDLIFMVAYVVCVGVSLILVFASRRINAATAALLIVIGYVSIIIAFGDHPGKTFFSEAHRLGEKALIDIKYLLRYWFLF